MSAQSVLVIEDDPQIGRLMSAELQEAGYHVDLIANGYEGYKQFENESYDLVVLDLLLPKLDGLEICRRIRGCNSYTPIIMVSAKTEMSDIVRGLELGADDYLSKPFGVAELMARINALFRRIKAYGDRPCRVCTHQVIQRGQLKIDIDKHEVCIADQIIGLTAKEFELLTLFATHPNRTFNRNDLLEAIWGAEFEGYEHTVNTHINRLRSKINKVSIDSDFIETVWGVGYRFRLSTL